jgi:hypothetical protein
VWEGEGDQRKGSGGSESGQDTPIIVEEGSWWGWKKKKVRWGGDPFRILSPVRGKREKASESGEGKL